MDSNLTLLTAFLISPSIKVLGDTIVGKIVDENFLNPVLAKCRNKRLKLFCSSLFRTYEFYQNKNYNENEFSKIISALCEDELIAEQVHEAARSAELSRSKKVGPLIIGLLTGRLLSQKRKPTETEEKFYLAAEQLSDDELIEFSNSYLRIEKIHEILINPKKEIFVELRDQYLSERSSANFIEESPGYLPLWVIKMKNLGVIFETLKRETIGELTADGESVDTTTLIRYEYTLSIYYRELAVIIRALSKST